MVNVTRWYSDVPAPPKYSPFYDGFYWLVYSLFSGEEVNATKLGDVVVTH